MAEQYFGITDTGKERKNNEDTFIAQQSKNKQYIIACVIDGIGGYSGGEVAAEITRKIILKRLEKPSGEIIPALTNCFELANEKIIAERQQVKEHNSMGCVSTLALVDIANNQLYYAHVGDTRLYLLRDKSLVKISHDQSFVGFLEESGRLTEEAAMRHPKRNEINKGLGFESDLSKDSDYIETGQSPFLTGDLILLCSDGLTDMVNSAEITKILTSSASLKEKGKQLIDAANRQGGRDNITVVLVHNDKVPVKHQTAKPAVSLSKNDDQEFDEPLRPPTSPVSPANPDPKPKTSREAVVILSLLLIFFLAIIVYQFFQNRKADPPITKQPAIVVKKATGAQQSKLQQAIDNVKGHILVLSDTAYKTPVLLSEALRIDRDSLLLKAKGKIILQSDSGYNGPAFVLSAKCKNIILDSLTIKDFHIGIATANNALALKNLRFENCALSLQNNFALADKRYINGKLPAIGLKADSLPVISK